MATKLAHVSYVLTPDELSANQGADYHFLVEPFTDPVNLATVAISLVLVSLVITLGRRNSAIRDRLRFFRGRARSYTEYIPAILRVCVGIALIGAGSQEALISPAVIHEPEFATLQIVLGFLLVAGFLLTPAIIASLALTIGALILNPTLFDNLEILGALIALLMLGQAKPGLDDLLGLPSYSIPEKFRVWVPTILRLGLGGALLIMAIGDKLLNPHWFGMVIEHQGLVELLPFSTGMWVVSATIIETILGLTLLFGFQTRLASLATFGVLSIFFFIFGEEVYAHVTLFGVLFTLLITGGGPWSIDNALYVRRKQQA